MAVAQGVSKQTRFKRQAAGKGTIAGTSAGQVLRRTSSIHELQKETYDTNAEINSTQQAQSLRHGPRLVNASISGLLSPGTYSDIMAAVLRRDFTAVSSIGSLSVTIAGTGPTYTITRGSGDFLTAGGPKVGYVIRLAAAGLDANNAAKNLLVTAVTSTVTTVRVLNPDLTLTAEGPIASTTMSFPGKVTFVPATGHTDVWYTVEEWYPDISVSEVNQDIKYGNIQLGLPGSGNATIQITGNGLVQNEPAASVYFTSPTAETTTDVVAASCGILLVNGTAQATVTDLQATINGQLTPADGVVGSVTRPGIFRGKVVVTGQFTAYFEDSTTPTLFTAETEFGIVEATASSLLANADFITLGLPRVKLTSSTPDDGETGLKRTYQFTATYNFNGAATASTEKTTIQIHDSAAS